MVLSVLLSDEQSSISGSQSVVLSVLLSDEQSSTSGSQSVSYNFLERGAFFICLNEKDGPTLLCFLGKPDLLTLKGR